MFWDPFEEMSKMHEEMDRLFGRMLGSNQAAIEHKGKGSRLVPSGKHRTPVCELCEKDNKLVAKFEIPGIDRKDIELNITDTHIEVSAEKKEEKESKSKDSYQYTRSSTSFYRAVPLPYEVQTKSADAEYKNGVLTVEIPKAKQLEHKKSRIQIR